MKKLKNKTTGQIGMLIETTDEYAELLVEADRKLLNRPEISSDYLKDYFKECHHGHHYYEEMIILKGWDKHRPIIETYDNADIYKYWEEV
jgi:ubiquinone/menaquinone biosynthesis C-methylase UbiE